VATVAVTTVEPFSDHLPAIEAAQDTDQLATDRQNMIGHPDLPKTGEQDRTTEKDAGMQWKVIAGALTFEGRIYVPDALRKQVICLFHDNPESGHFGSLRNADLISAVFYWLILDTLVRKYVAGCKVCY